MNNTDDPGALAGSARLPGLSFEDRPSGSKLAIVAMPRAEQSVAPFTLARISVPVGVTTAEDCHEVREVWLIQSGSGLLTVDGRQIRISAGDCLYYESYRKHQLFNDGGAPIEVVSIWWRP